jgi:hypothetical protein
VIEQGVRESVPQIGAGLLDKKAPQLKAQILPKDPLELRHREQLVQVHLAFDSLIEL